MKRKIVCILFFTALILSLASCKHDLGEHPGIFAEVEQSTEGQACRHRLMYEQVHGHVSGRAYLTTEYHYVYCYMYERNHQCDFEPRIERHGPLTVLPKDGIVTMYNGRSYHRVMMKCETCGRQAGVRYELIEEGAE